MKKRIIYVLVMSFLLVSCGSTQMLYKYDGTEAFKLDPTFGKMYVTPIAVDLDVKSTKIVYSKQFENELTAADVMNPEDSKLFESMRMATFSEAAIKNNVDVIISPTYEYFTSSNYRTITVTVHGYPAVYTNFRKATAADTSYIYVTKDEVKKKGESTESMSIMTNLFGNKKKRNNN